MNKKPKRAMKQGLILAIIIMSFCMLISCQAKNQSKKEITQDEAIQVTGHILYGYKHGLMVYGQYMDQAGEDNAMVLVFVEHAPDSTVRVNCNAISVNGVQVNSNISTEKISSSISALQINLMSEQTNIDQLCEEDEIGLVLEIMDQETNETIEITEQILFPCN